ncbi:hypothetical protein BC830DRAFT_1086919, partial [Chytriomyces sp. MP71]
SFSLVRWHKYVGPSSGVPVEYALPDTKYASSLSRFNFKIFNLPTFKSHGDKKVWRNELPFRIRKNGHITNIRRIKVSNVWISGNLRETGENASSFPWRFIAFICFLCLPIGDFFIRSSDVLAHASSKPYTVALISIAIIMLLLSGLLDLRGMLDQRIYMDPCLRPLMATNNFNPAKKAPKKWIGSRGQKWARAEEGNHVVSTESINEEPNYLGSVLHINTQSNRNSEKRVFPLHVTSDQNGTSSLKLFVAVHDFATNHVVATNLRRFFHKIGFRQPRNDSDYSNHNTIVVHIFVFGGGISSTMSMDRQKAILVDQVATFNAFLIKNGLRVDDCVLIAAGAESGGMEVPGLFKVPLNFPGQADSTLGDYLLLIDLEPFFHIGSALGKALGAEHNPKAKSKKMQQQALTHAVSIEEGGPANGDTAIYVDGSPSDPSQFFDILDLPHPQKGGTPKDLEIYFGNGAFTTGVVNPYHSPPSNEPLIPFQQLPLIQFTSKIKTLCPSSKLVTLANFNFDHHYELGHCLIWEKKDKIPRNPGKQPRFMGILQYQKE